MILFWLIILFFILSITTLIILRARYYAHCTQQPLTALHYALFSLAPVLVLIGYIYWGNSQKLPQWFAYRAQQQVVAQFSEQLKNPQQIIERMQAILKAHPQSVQGWYLLARLYVSQQNYQQAVLAFARANTLEPNNIDILEQYAQALFLAEKQTINTRLQQVLAQIVQLQPNNILVTNLQALAAFHQQNYLQAIQLWQTLLTQVPPGSNDAAGLTSIIHQAQQQLAMIPHANALAVKVQLALGIRPKVPLESAVFIYAKAAKGLDIPLAVVKKQVRDLPLTVYLSDALAMLPTQKLSQYENIYIYAKIAENGQADQLSPYVARSKLIKLNQQTDVVLIISNKD
ncbi:MAG: hypothetical protein Tsb005_02910 [Gammaproteobacteria bacterium]